MANIYRRRKGGKNGKLIGSWLLPFKGRDVNLKTKNAVEARRRAVLVEKGEWPPVDAAAEAAAAAAAPGVEEVEVPAEAAPEPIAPPAEVPRVAAPVAPVLPVSESADPAAAAASIAAEMSGEEAHGEAAAVAADEQSKVDAKLAAIMAKLGGGPGGGDVLGVVCGQVADLVLAMERKTIELGGTWAMKRRGSKGSFEPGDPPELMREALAAGLHGYAVTWFPDFAARLTPGWAVVLGLGGGGFAMLVGGRALPPPKEGEGAAPSSNGSQPVNVSAPSA